MMLSEVIREKVMPVDVQVNGISDDSRRTRPGDLFCAVTGESHDGRAYVDDAIAAGAVAVLCDPPVLEAPVPVIGIEGLRCRLGEFAGRVLGHPGSAIEVIAVTGTNGKTSFTHLLAQALSEIDWKTGLVGTMGHGTPGRLRRPGLTTPPAVDLQYRLKELVDDGCSAVVLEASSHGLVQDRLGGVEIDTAVFTNITHDHLDYHESFSSYQAAKRRLFEFESIRNAVINLDDDFSASLIEQLRADLNIVRFSRDDSSADVHATRIDCTPDGLELGICVGDDLVEVKLPLFGRFNVENVLAVVATLVAMNINLRDMESALGALTPVAGRMDLVKRAGKPTFIVDYAHTPDALEKCLQAVRDHFDGCRVHCVFGCGGDRDRDKRPMMGEIAARLSSRVVLTSDNPRSEDPLSIIEDIRAGMAAGAVESCPDRGQAIEAAVAGAEKDDVVLVAGKGHEEYQELGDGRIAFSDYEAIEESLKRWPANNGRGE